MDSGDGKRDKPVRCRTVEQRIRSGGKNEERTALEVNAEGRRNPSEKLRGTVPPGVKREYRSQQSPAHGASRERPATHLGIATKPFSCSNRDSDWMDRRAWNRSIAYSVDPASSRACSPQIADLARRPAPGR